METLVDFNESDLPSIEGFIPGFNNKDLIQDVELIWNHAKERKACCWEGVAIKFVEGLTQEKIMEYVVDLHAGAYEGVQDGHHLFVFN